MGMTPGKTKKYGTAKKLMRWFINCTVWADLPAGTCLPTDRGRRRRKKRLWKEIRKILLTIFNLCKNIFLYLLSMN